MKITYTSDFSDERGKLLATLKGWTPTITTIIETTIPEHTVTTPDGEVIVEEHTEIRPTETANPQSPAEYLAEVYLGIISRDASQALIQYNDSQKQVEWDEMDNLIRESVKNSITYTVE